MHKNEEGGRHSSVVAFALLTLRPQVWISATLYFFWIWCCWVNQLQFTCRRESAKTLNSWSNSSRTCQWQAYSKINEILKLKNNINCCSKILSCNFSKNCQSGLSSRIPKPFVHPAENGPAPFHQQISYSHSLLQHTHQHVVRLDPTPSQCEQRICTGLKSLIWSTTI